MCTTFVGQKKAFFERYGFTVRPIQEPGLLDTIQIDEIELMTSIHLITKYGRVLKGPQFFKEVSRQIWWMTPIYWLLKIPLFFWVFGIGYAAIAKRRQAISHVCGLQKR
jgi:hypothetical protein